MSDFDYAPNSHKSKENASKTESIERARPEKVTSGSVSTSKKSFGRKALEAFLPTQSELETTIYEMLIPAIVDGVKITILDTIAATFGMGNYYHTGSYRNNSNASKVSYNKYYRNSDSGNGSRIARATDGYDYDNIIFVTREDAVNTLNGMLDILDRYKTVRLDDYYALAGVTTHNYQVNNFGWINLDTARIVRARDGWRIELPRVVELSNN